MLDLNGAAGGNSYSTTWLNAGPVNLTTADATVTDADTPNLSQLTVALSTVHAGDTLTANTTGTSITATFGSGTLTLSGSDTQAHYTTVLRTIQYNNTSGGPGVATVTAKFVASDGTLTSTEQDTTINIDTPPVVDLDTLVRRHQLHGVDERVAGDGNRDRQRRQLLGHRCRLARTWLR